MPAAGARGGTLGESIVRIFVVAAASGTLLQTGLLFATEKLGFDVSRISPMGGLKRMFSMKSGIELLKSIAKIGAEFGEPDIVFTGKQTIDGDTAQVGPGIAKRLHLLQLTYVARIAALDPAARTIEVERRAEGGVQLLATRLPCLVTMLEATNEIRRGTMNDALRAARAEIVRWSAKDIAIEDMTKCGLRGSPTVVKRVFAPTARAQKAILVDATDQPPAAALIAEIFKQRPALESELAALARGF